MSKHNEDAARDLVQRAYQADPEPADLDIKAGLADVLARAKKAELINESRTKWSVFEVLRGSVNSQTASPR